MTGQALEPGHSGNTGARLKSHSTETSRSEDLMEDLPKIVHRSMSNVIDGSDFLIKGIPLGSSTGDYAV